VKFTDEAWNKWGEWLKSIKADLQPALLDADVFRDFSAVIEENSAWIDQHEGGYFCGFIARCYAHRMALAVRRQIKEGSQSISLMRIIGQIRLCAPQITFADYMRFFPAEPIGPPWQALTFRKMCDPNVPSVTDDVTVSETVIGQDVARLQQASSAIEAFADRVVAHADSRGFQGKVSFADLRTAVEAFDQVAIKYIVFLTGDGYDSLKPHLQFNWNQIFDYPLREPKSARLFDT